MARSEDVVAAFAGSDSDGFLYVGDEDFAVSGVIGAGAGDDRLDRRLDVEVRDDRDDLTLGIMSTT